MSNNSNLNNASQAEQNEFYTLLSDIEEELRHYTKHFEGKTVYCNCDDPNISNFAKYFILKFKRLKLKRLICTCCDSNVAGILADHTRNGALCLDYHGEEEIVIKSLQGNGDFASDECIEYLKQADIVVTNPPFSLFRKFVSLLIDYSKQFLIIGNENSLTCIEIFKLFKNNQVWLGYHTGHTLFEVPDSYTIPEKYANTEKKILEANGYHFDENGKLWRNLGNICWYTNLEIRKRHQPVDLYKRYSPSLYKKYDNYDAINVDQVENIPYDYDGVMGVPVSYLEKHCPDQFSILGNESDLNISKGRGYVDGKRKFGRIFIQKNKDYDTEQ